MFGGNAESDQIGAEPLVRTGVSAAGEQEGVEDASCVGVGPCGGQRLLGGRSHGDPRIDGLLSVGRLDDQPADVDWPMETRREQGRLGASPGQGPGAQEIEGGPRRPPAVEPGSSRARFRTGATR